jgi:MFS family permease
MWTSSAEEALRSLQADIVPENIRGRLIGFLESMSNVGSSIGAPIAGFIWDHFHGRDIGLPWSLDGTMIPFLVSGLLGIFTVLMVHVVINEKRIARVRS